MRVLFFTSGTMWSNTLPVGFKKAGHEVRVSGPIIRYDINQMINAFCPQLIVSMGWGNEQNNNDLQFRIQMYAKRAQIANVYWSLEDPAFTESFTIPLLKKLRPDFVFTISKASIDTFKKLGFSAAHMDFAYEPDLHHSLAPDECYRCSIAVVANAYPHVLANQPSHFRLVSLQNLVTPLIKANIRVDFWGRDWSKMEPYLDYAIPSQWIHGYLPYMEANRVYNSAKIIIGLQNYETQLTQRTYEILGSEGFLLTSDTPEVRRLFKPGYDLLTASSPAVTLQLVESYLHKPAERETIRKQGKRTIIGETYQRRAEYMVQVLKASKILGPDLP